MIPRTQPIEILTEARKRKVDWKLVAEAVRALEAAGHSEPGLTPIKYAAELSGYAPGHLRRMQRGLAFLEQINAVDPGAAAGLRRRPFAHVEMLDKIWRVDPQALWAFFNKQGWGSYPALVNVYEDLRTASARTAPMAAGKRQARAFREHCLAVLSRQTDLFKTLGSFEKIVKPYVPLRHAAPDFIVCASRHDRRLLAGLDCLSWSSQHDRDAVERRVRMVATECTYFTEFYLAMPPGDALGEAATDIQEFDLRNVGLIEMGQSEARLLFPPHGPPVPNRSDRINGWEYERLGLDR